MPGVLPDRRLGTTTAQLAQLGAVGDDHRRCAKRRQRRGSDRGSATAFDQPIFLTLPPAPAAAESVSAISDPSPIANAEAPSHAQPRKPPAADTPPDLPTPQSAAKRTAPKQSTPEQTADVMPTPDAPPPLAPPTAEAKPAKAHAPRFGTKAETNRNACRQKSQGQSRSRPRRAPKGPRNRPPRKQPKPVRQPRTAGGATAVTKAAKPRLRANHQPPIKRR